MAAAVWSQSSAGELDFLSFLIFSSCLQIMQMWINASFSNLTLLRQRLRRKARLDNVLKRFLVVRRNFQVERIAKLHEFVSSWESYFVTCQSEDDYGCESYESLTNLIGDEKASKSKELRMTLKNFKLLVMRLVSWASWISVVFNSIPNFTWAKLEFALSDSGYRVD